MGISCGWPFKGAKKSRSPPRQKDRLQEEKPQEEKPQNDESQREKPRVGIPKWCEALDEAKIRYSVINVHALYRYRIYPTGFFGGILALVVKDRTRAVELIHAAGYRTDPWETHIPWEVYQYQLPEDQRQPPRCNDRKALSEEAKFIEKTRCTSESVFMTSEEASLECSWKPPTILMWDESRHKVEFGTDFSDAERYPTLPYLVNWYLEQYTVKQHEHLRRYWAHLLKDLYDDSRDYWVKIPEFADHLTKENLQLHFDLVAGVAQLVLDDSATATHYRRIRRQINEGAHVPVYPLQNRG